MTSKQGIHAWAASRNGSVRNCCLPNCNICTFVKIYDHSDQGGVAGMDGEELETPAGG